MEYDPIKRKLGAWFNTKPFLRKFFYKLLDVLLLRTWHIKKEIKKWEKLSPGEKNLLDAGSGFGQYSYYLSSKNEQWKITGIDVKEEQIADCNAFFTRINRNQVHFEIGDLTTYKKDNHFDMILSVDVMEHILEDRDVFTNFYQSLKPKGLLLISTPSDQGGSDAHDHEDGSFIGEHVRNGYSIEDITEKLAGAGFKDISADYTYGTFGKLSWKLSMKFPILMLNASKALIFLLPFYYLLFFPFCLIFNTIDVFTSQKSGTGLIVKALK